MLKAVDIRHFKGVEHVTLENCGPINALLGKNNSGKSTVLQAIDMAGLAFSVGNWNRFQPKLEIKDLFWEAGDFKIDLKYTDDRTVSITTRDRGGPQFKPGPSDDQKFKSIFIQPDPGYGLLRRQHRTPQQVMNHLEERNYTEVNSLDILYAIKFYAQRRKRNLTPERYNELINEVKRYFPDLTDVESDRTEADLATLTYEEYGRRLDILYSGTGLKHFLDVLIKTILSEARVILIDEPEMGLHPHLQRQFMQYLRNLASSKNLQFFIATHSPVVLNHADCVNFYRIVNTKGKREVTPIPPDATHTLLGDLGIKPSDIFSSDICVLVEGQTDVIFFEYLLREIYKAEFEGVSISVVQYGGSAAEGIIDGSIEVRNLVPAQKYTLWLRDRDAAPEQPPATTATQFKNALERRGLACHVWAKREVEFYFPESLHVAAQQGDAMKEARARAVLNGSQDQKFRDAVGPGVCCPTGKNLRRLLAVHVTNKDHVELEIRRLIEGTLLPWKRQITGEQQ